MRYRPRWHLEVRRPVRAGAAALVVVASAGVTGCAGAEPASPVTVTQTQAVTATSTVTASPRVTSAAAAGQDAFERWARSAKIGDYPMGLAKESDILALGDGACEMVELAPTFEDALREMRDAMDADASNAQTEELIREAVTNLCPEHTRKLP